MNSIEITERLAKGSKNIDHMKSVIRNVVNMVLTMAFECREDCDHSVSRDFRSDTCTWLIKGIIRPWPTRGGRLDLECSIHGSGDEPRAWKIEDNGENVVTLFSPCAADTQAIYDGLPQFVAGMLELFPALAKKWEPYMKAADRVF